MQRLKEIVKYEIKEIDKQEISKASIVMLGKLVDILKGIKEIEKIEKMNNMTKQKLRMYRVLNMYAFRKEERRPQAVSSLLILANFTYFAYSLSIQSKKLH